MKREVTEHERVEAALRKSHDRLIDTLESMTDGFVSLDKNWRYIYVNTHAGEMFGREPKDLIGKHIWTEFPEGIGQPFYHNYYKAVKEQKPITMEEYYPPWNRWFENRIYPTADGICIFFQEITERKRADELLKGQKQLLEMVAAGQPLLQILTALIHVIESQAPDMLCTILLMEDDGIHIRHGAAPSMPEEFIAGIDGYAIGPNAGSCGTAAFRGEAVFVENIATDSLWADYKHLALPYDLHACWSTPIFDEQHRVLGTFAIYYRQPALPEPFHLQLIEVATHIAAISITRDRNEAILRRSEQQLGLIYDTVGDIIFLLDVQPNDRYRFASVNQAFLDATGLNEKEVVGRYAEEVIPASAHQLVFENYKRAIQTQRPVQWEEVSVFPAGKKTAIVKVSPVFDKEGLCTNLVGAIHDITEFREAEEAVRKSQEELEHVYRTTPVGLAIVDENLRFMRVNEEFAALSGKAAEDHIGKTLQEIFPGVRSEVEEPYRKVIASGHPLLDQEIHGQAPAQPDRERDWLASYYPVQSKDEKVRGVGVVLVEITDRVATAALGQMALGDTDLDRLFHVAREIVAKTLDIPFVAIFELMTDRKTLTPRLTFGWTVEIPKLPSGKDSQAGYTLLVGEPVIVEDLRNETRFNVPGYLVEQGIISSMTVLILGKAAPYGVLGAYTNNRRDFSSAEVHFLQSVANILGTVIERKKLEEQIFQAQKLELIGGLAAGVAHQLNTPLAVIMMRLQMLKEDLASVVDSSILSQLDIVVTSAKKMSTIIQDLLNFSRVPKLQKEKIQIETVLKHILNFVEVRARKQNVELRSDFSHDLPPLDADKNRLEQAFLNIIMNALDATPDGGFLSISTAAGKMGQTDCVRIEFHDSGHGIPQDLVAKIFDPFFTTKPVGQGTGLGLSVSYEIIRSHGGEIRVSSEKGEGSNFEVLLPV